MAQEAKNAVNLQLVHRPERDFQALNRVRHDSSSGDFQSAEKVHIFFDRQGKYQQTALLEAEQVSFLKALEKEEKAKQHFNGERSGKQGELRGVQRGTPRFGATLCS